MKNRDRFINTLLFNKPDDRLPMIEWASWWDKTLERWRGEGLLDDIGPDETREYLGLDMLRQFWISSKKDSYPVMPYGQGSVTDETSYESMREQFLYPDDVDDKILNDLMRLKPLHDSGEAVVWITLEGFFWHPRELFGIENHFYAFYDESKLMCKMNEDLTAYNIRAVERLCDILKPDFMTFAEDLSYNLGSMLSYEQFKKFLLPYYKMIIPILQKHDIIPLIDTDGQVEPVIPWLIEAGIEGVLPLERQAGVDVARIRETYPAFKMIGAYDKMVMSQGEAAMRGEFERLLPVMRSGGFIPSCDHQTPPGVSLENYRIYLRLMREYCERAVRP